MVCKVSQTQTGFLPNVSSWGVVVGTLFYMFTVLDSGPTPLPAQVGLTFVQDHSGRVFKRKGTAAVTLKDVQANREVSSW